MPCSKCENKKKKCPAPNGIPQPLIYLPPPVVVTPGDVDPQP